MGCSPYKYKFVCKWFTWFYNRCCLWAHMCVPVDVLAEWPLRVFPCQCAGNLRTYRLVFNEPQLIHPVRIWIAFPEFSAFWEHVLDLQFTHNQWAPWQKYQLLKISTRLIVSKGQPTHKCDKKKVNVSISVCWQANLRLEEQVPQ